MPRIATMRTAAPCFERRAQLGGTEVAQPRPQAEVRVERDLGLHADEMGDRRQGIEIGSFEQQLASHRRPVEGTPVEGRHGATSWPPKAVISWPAEIRKPVSPLRS